jgi:hypothetical protein
MDTGTLTDKQKFVQVVRDAISKLEKQGVQSLDEITGSCAYRGGNNTRCIIGFMIEDAQTALCWDVEQFTLQSINVGWDFERKKVKHTENNFPSDLQSKLETLSTEIGVELNSEQVLLLSFLQILHDTLDCLGTFRYKTMNVRLNAKEWDLRTRISLMERAVGLYEVSLE